MARLVQSGPFGEENSVDDGHNTRGRACDQMTARNLRSLPASPPECPEHLGSIYSLTAVSPPLSSFRLEVLSSTTVRLPTRLHRVHTILYGYPYPFKGTVRTPTIASDRGYYLRTAHLESQETSQLPKLPGTGRTAIQPTSASAVSDGESQISTNINKSWVMEPHCGGCAYAWSCEQ